MILRLLITEKCHRNCPGCCNKDWDLPNLERETRFGQYDMILLTGGEPMLEPDRTIRIARMIRNQTLAPIYMYTALVSYPAKVLQVLAVLDGITVTLHTYEDVAPFLAFNEILQSVYSWSSAPRKSYRLNVFKNVLYLTSSENWDTQCLWNIKPNIEWIKNCPLPKDEVLKRIEK